MIQTRNYFFTGIDGATGVLFRTGNLPTKNTYKDLFESVPFKLEVADTATIAQAGHSMIATAANAVLRSDTYGDLHTRFTVASMLPNVLHTPTADHASAGAATTAYGISIEYYDYSPGSVLKRRDTVIKNDMTLASALDTVTVTETGTTKHFNVEVNYAHANAYKVMTDAGATPGYLLACVEPHHFVVNTHILEIRYQDTTSINLDDDALGIKASLIHANVSLETVAGGVQIRDNVDTIGLTTTYLRTTGNQTVASGIKTFVTYPQISVYAAPTIDTEFAPKKYVNDQDALDVHLAGAQTITGSKEFNLFPWKTGPGLTPTLPAEFTTKDYVDSLYLGSAMWELNGTATHGIQSINSITGCTASGDYSLAVGFNCTSGGNYSGAFGLNVSTPGNYSFGFGQLHSLAGSFAFAGGYANNCSGSRSTSFGFNNISSGTETLTVGMYCQAKAPQSMVFGYNGVSPINIPGSIVHASDGSNGNRQELNVKLRVSTTDATPTNLQLSDGSDGITIPTDCGADVFIRLIAVRTGGTDATGAVGDTARQIIKCGVQNLSGVSTVVPMNAATLANYSTVAGDILYELSSAHANFINGVSFVEGTTVTVSVAANKIQIRVTGEANKNITWLANVSLLWIGYNAFVV